MPAVFDFTGKRCGMLLVQERSGNCQAYGESVPAWKCVCDCGSVVVKPSRYLRQSAIPNCGCATKANRAARLDTNRRARLVDLAGQQFGSWQVLERGTTSRSGSVRWRCLCTNCGKEGQVHGEHLRKGSSRGCGCLIGSRVREARFQGIGLLHQGHYSRIKARATCGGRRAPLEFSVSIQYLWDLFCDQQGHCAISGLELEFPKSLGVKDARWATASLDRIDNTQGYVEGNVQWVHKHINMMKRDLSQTYFVRLCNAVAANNEGCLL